MSSNADSSHQGSAANRALQRYYQLHSRIYDATRWSFLFGRNAIVERAADVVAPRRILEVGCGTGKNLHALAQRFPNAELAGIDLSGEMLDIARRKLAPLGERIQLHQHAYSSALAQGDGFDLVLFSYALSMFNPGWETAVDAASHDLSSNGVIAVVDFHNSRFGAFRKWMGVNHVRMDGHLLPVLTHRFLPLLSDERSAYGGIWRYFLFIGRPH